MVFPLIALLAAQSLPEIAIERRMADGLGLRVGDTLEIAPRAESAPTRFVVRAIYRPLPDPATALRGEYQIRLHLPDFADLLRAPDRVDQIAVKVRPGISPDSAATRLNRLAFGYRAYPSSVLAEESSRTFTVVSRFHRAIGFIAIVASAIFLLCIMLLKVEERRQDTAVMRMVGVGRRTVVGAVVLEACFVAVVGSIFGVLIAELAAVVTNLIYQRRFETALTFAHLTPAIIVLGVGISLGLGVVTGFLAAIRLVRVKPLVLFRRA